MPKITHLFKFKSIKKMVLNFKDGWQQLGKEKCTGSQDPETWITIPVGDNKVGDKVTGKKDNSTKYSDAKDLELQADQELQLTIMINNTVSQCKKMSYDFGIIATERE